MDKLKLKINEIIDSRSTTLNNDINYKLRQARQKALKPRKTKFNLFNMWYIPTTTFAALAIYFMLPFLQIKPKQLINFDSKNISVVISEIEIIEQLELIENLEFYEWLSLEEDSSSI